MASGLSPRVNDRAAGAFALHTGMATKRGEGLQGPVSMLHTPLGRSSTDAG